MPQPGVAAAITSRAVGLPAGDGDMLDREWVDVLADVPLFAGLSRRHLRRVAQLARTRRFDAGTTIFRAGESGDAFYVLLDGAARVRRRGGRTVRLGPGDFFGEMALLDDAPRSAAVEATEEALMLRIGRAGFSKLLAREPRIALAVLRTLAARVRSLEPADA